eukprot:5065731-Pyramimonas_sp.AAC.1
MARSCSRFAVRGLPPPRPPHPSYSSSGCACFWSCLGPDAPRMRDSVSQTAACASRAPSGLGRGAP